MQAFSHFSDIMTPFLAPSHTVLETLPLLPLDFLSEFYPKSWQNQQLEALMIRSGSYDDNILVNNNLGEGVFCIIDSEQWCGNFQGQTWKIPDHHGTVLETRGDDDDDWKGKKVVLWHSVENTEFYFVSRNCVKSTTYY